jgi:hypothetical protein
MDVEPMAEGINNWPFWPETALHRTVVSFAWMQNQYVPGVTETPVKVAENPPVAVSAMLAVLPSNDPGRIGLTVVSLL